VEELAWKCGDLVKRNVTLKEDSSKLLSEASLKINKSMFELYQINEVLNPLLEQ